eukprot:71068_1
MAGSNSTLLLFVILFSTIYSYNNGIGKTPILGFSSWYIYEYAVTEYLMQNNTLELINRGLAKAGYEYMNIDAGWILNRSANGTLVYDPVKFPNGMYNMGEFIHSHNLKYGLYGTRGTKQCGFQHGYYAPGSLGYYENDANYTAAMKADYFIFDSCSGTANMTDALNEYEEFGMYLNKTGRTIYYDLCWWNAYYAQFAVNFSNSYRVGRDDTNWSWVLNSFEIAYSGMQKNGNPYGWNNLDLLYSTNANKTDYNKTNPNIGFQTELQARAQFAVYALASSNLIISNAIAYLSQYDIETYTNADLINANQDNGPIYNGPWPSSGFKIYGLTAANDMSIFGKMLSDGSFMAAFLNAKEETSGNMDIVCDSSCSVQMGFNKSVTEVQVYDVYNKKDLGKLPLKNVLNGYKVYNGILEMGMCIASKDQIWEYESDTKIIKSKYNNGILGVIDCNGNAKQPLITVYDYDINPLCNGDEAIWDIIEVKNPPNYCNGYKCVNICSRLYENDNKGNDKCLYADTIKGNNYIFAFWEDGTIR